MKTKVMRLIEINSVCFTVEIIDVAIDTLINNK